MKDSALGKLAIKSGIWYTVANFFVKSLSILTLPIFTRVMSQGEFGSFSNFTSWQNLLLIVITLNVESTLISARFDFKNFDKYIFSILLLSSFSALIWMFLLNIFESSISMLLEMDIFYVNCIMIYILFYPSINLFQIRERYLYRYKGSVLLSVGISLLTVILSVFFVIIAENKFLGRVLGNVVPTVLIGIALYFYFFIKGKKLDIYAWKYALPICLPYIPHLLSLTILNATDKIMITKICGSNATALYSLAYSCGTMVTLLMTSLNGAFSPWLGNKLNSKEYDEIRKVSILYVAGFCYIALGLMLFAPEVLQLLGGASYMESQYTIPPVAMGCICQFVYTMYVNIEQFKKNTVKMAIASASAAILNCVLNLICIPIFGYIAAAYTTLISYTWLLIVHIWIVRKMGMGMVYNLQFICKLLIIMFLLTISINALYRFNFIRYGCFFLYIIILFIIILKNKEKWKILLK